MSRIVAPKWSIGATISVIVGNQKVVNRTEGQLGGNDFLQVVNSESNTVDLEQVFAVSHATSEHFFSVSAITPTLRVIASGQQEVNNLISTQTPLVSGREFKPKDRKPWSLGIGYSMTKSLFRPSVDIRYFLPDSYTRVDGPTAANSVDLQFDGFFQVGVGGEVSVGSTSIMLGVNNTQKRIEKNIGINESEIFLATAGVRIKSLESNPIVGLYYEIDKADDDLTRSQIGLMYSTNYNL